MMDADVAARRGLPILGLFRGMQLAGVAPEEMSIAIAPVVRGVLKHHQLAMADVDLWELREAYAVTTLYNQAQLGTPWETTNVNGGAVPLCADHLAIASLQPPHTAADADIDVMDPLQSQRVGAA
jgi:acetyl-CoA C-acetyltransferase